AVTDRLTLYISPESIWFACAGAVVVLAGAIWSFALPLGAESDHGHDHGQSAHSTADTSTDAADEASAVSSRRTLTKVGTISAGVVASGMVVASLVLPPASLSVELAMSRADAGGTLFAGADTPTLGVADTTPLG